MRWRAVRSLDRLSSLQEDFRWALEARPRADRWLISVLIVEPYGLLPYSAQSEGNKH